MTAAEFLKKEDSIRRWCLLGPACAMVLSAIFIMVFLPGSSYQLKLMVGLCVVGFSGLIVIAFVQDFLLSRFSAKHPEMKHLTEWKKAGGTTENYPATDEAQATEFALTTAKTRARAADVARQMCNRVELQNKKLTSDDPGTDVYTELLGNLKSRAEVLQASYTSFCNLVNAMDMSLVIPPEDFQKKERALIY